MFDEYLKKHAADFPFDIARDYQLYVDGKARFDGVRDFLASRNIRLPEGNPDDPPQASTLCGLGNLRDCLDLVDHIS